MCLLQLDMILPEKTYSFFSHTHKAQRENMPLLDKVSASLPYERVCFLC